MKDSELIDVFTSLAPFLSAVLGKGCEVVVHNLKDPNHSVVAIENSLSGRELGDPMTDLPMDHAKDSDYVANYSGKGKGRDFLSSSYYIKNKGKVIGLLCINKDMTNLSEMSHALTAFLEKFNLSLAQNQEAINENLDNSVEEIMKRRIEEAIAEISVPPSRMSLEEKIRITHTLKSNGVLSMKGAVNELANQLGISVPTVYRYMAKE